MVRNPVSDGMNMAQSISTYLGRQRAILGGAFRNEARVSDRLRFATFFRGAQNADGGFSGREGGSDLYYTAFGLWGLAVLESLDTEVAVRAARFLRENWQRPTHLVDFFSLMHGYRLIREIRDGDAIVNDGLPEELRGSGADWPDLVTMGLETCRSADGGYARTPGQKGGSTYATFLTVLCYEEVDRPLPDRQGIERFLQTRSRPDGGFVELAPMRRSGTNTTAAAVAVRRILGLEEPSVNDRVHDFLVGLQGPDGGLRANTVIPISDLLSTFTGLWTLSEVGGWEGLEIQKVRGFVEMMADASGGFRAGLWDDVADVEYSFYGIASSALLASSSSNGAGSGDDERSSGATA